MAEFRQTDAQAFYEWYGSRVDSKDGSKPYNANIANKDWTNLRILVTAYWTYEGDRKLRHQVNLECNFAKASIFWYKSRLRENAFGVDKVTRPLQGVRKKYFVTYER